MPPKSKVYGKTKRKKDDDFCAAFQDLHLSTPVQAVRVSDSKVGENLEKKVMEKGKRGKDQENLLIVVEDVILKRDEDLEKQGNEEKGALNLRKIGMEDSLIVAEPVEQSTKGNRRHVFREITELKPLPAQHDLAAKESIPGEEIAKGSYVGDAACEEVQTGSRLLRSAKTGKPTHSCCSTLILEAETLNFLSPLTNIAGVGSAVKAMEQWYQEWTTLCNMKKIAEGSYGSVFRLSDKEGVQEATIGKLMPLKSKSGKGSRKAGSTHVADAASEVLLLEKMSHVSGFVEFRSAEVLVGGLPKVLRKEYKAYENRRKDKSNSACFPCEVLYPDTQMWVFIEMGDAGTELEDALCLKTQENRIAQSDAQGQAILSVQQARDVFWGVAEALACGEEAHEFEHRDLHFSNICIKEKDGKSEGYRLVPNATSIEVTLIDYTLSRTTLSDGSIISNKMTDAEIFKAEGDLQFEVYRWMRDAMPGTNLKNKDWKAYTPLTNALWLYHLLAKLLQQTPRPVQHQEQELWNSLDGLERDIDPNNVPKRKIFSASDVLSYMRQGRSNYLRESKHENEDVFQIVKATRRMRIR